MNAPSLLVGVILGAVIGSIITTSIITPEPTAVIIDNTPLLEWYTKTNLVWEDYQRCEKIKELSQELERLENRK